jgi:hypothetical protein
MHPNNKVHTSSSYRQAPPSSIARLHKTTQRIWQHPNIAGTDQTQCTRTLRQNIRHGPALQSDLKDGLRKAVRCCCDAGPPRASSSSKLGCDGCCSGLRNFVAGQFDVGSALKPVSKVWRGASRRQQQPPDPVSARTATCNDPTSLHGPLPCNLPSGLAVHAMQSFHSTA